MEYLEIKKDLEKNQDPIIKALLNNKDIIIKTSKDGLKVQTVKIENIKK